MLNVRMAVRQYDGDREMAEEKEGKIKVYDLDGAFDQKIAEYMLRGRNRFTEEEWEDEIARQYEKYSGTYIKALGATPGEYYRRMDAQELSQVLREHFRQNVPVDGFLRSALEEEENRPILLELLRSENPEEVLFAMDLLGSERSLYPVYLTFLERGDEDLVRRAEELLEEDADFVADDLIALYASGRAKAAAADLLSRCLLRREEIYGILMEELETGENREDAAYRLGRYGDERAAARLEELAQDPGTGYLEWRALRVAAESLGGYVPERDFSDDADFQSLKREEKKKRRAIEKEDEKKNSREK